MGDAVETMELLVRVFLGSAVLLTAMLIVYVLFRRVRPSALSLGTDPLSGSPAEASRAAAFLAGSRPAKAPERATDPVWSAQTFDIRQALSTAYKIIMVAVTLVLLAATVFTFMQATVANGLGLVGGMLAIFTLIAALSINKYDRQQARAAFWQDLLAGDAVEGSRFVGATEVHSIDAELLERARRMNESGATLAAICSAIEPHYSTWGALRQAAFRALVKAMLQHKPAA